VSGHHSGERQFKVLNLKSVTRDAGCHVLYVPGSAAQAASQALDLIHGTPVLTVTDSVPGGSGATVVAFIVQENRVRFAIDDREASRNGLKISSELLKLALSVKPRS
jgi:hypothetical protein